MESLIQNGKLLKYRSDGSSRHAVLPRDITAIGDHAFADSDIVSAELPEGVTSIGLGAFCGCGSLERIILPERLTYIGREAFCLCGSLREIGIPEGVTRLNQDCFSRCESLASVSLSEKVILGHNVFMSCKQLGRIQIGEVILSGRSLTEAVAADCANIEFIIRAVKYGTIPYRLSEGIRAQLAAGLYLTRGVRDAKKYLCRNTVNIFRSLAADGRSDLIISLSSDGDIVGGDIDELIETVIAAEQHEAYIILTDLRHAAYRGESLEDRFTL